MSGMDIAAAAAAFVAGGALAIRSYMLRPDFASWCSAPRWVALSIMALSVTCMIVGLSIVRSGVPATPREALLLIVLAGAALAMLINLHRQSPAKAPPVKASPTGR
jgi:peptidoglycan/LPS O-acetylase OafA/YrhL